MHTLKIKVISCLFFVASTLILTNSHRPVIHSTELQIARTTNIQNIENIQQQRINAAVQKRYITKKNRLHILKIFIKISISIVFMLWLNNAPNRSGDSKFFTNNLFVYPAIISVLFAGLAATHYLETNAASKIQIPLKKPVNQNLTRLYCASSDQVYYLIPSNAIDMVSYEQNTPKSFSNNIALAFIAPVAVMPMVFSIIYRIDVLSIPLLMYLLFLF